MSISGTAGYPALTTTFTPDADCTQLTISSCFATDRCLGVALTDYQCTTRTPRCFPDSSIYTTSNFEYITPYQTYSPGSICPLGWSTAASALSPDGIWCCPTGFSFERSVQNCQGTFTEGTAVSVATDCSIIGTIPFGPGLTNSLPILSMGGIGSNIVPASQLTIQASAQGIFLLGQTLTSGSSGSMSIPGPSESVIGSGSDKVYLSSISTRTAIAASVGSTLGAILILGLGFFLIRRHRKRRREMAEGKGGDAQDSSASASTPLKAQDGDGTQKPELEGSGTDVARFDKNELDANTTRLELEGVVSSEMEAPVAPQELDPVVIRHELE